MKLIIPLFMILSMLLLASMFGTVNAVEVHKNGFGGITPLNTTGLTVFNDSLKRSFDYESDSLVLSAEFSILETNGDIRDFSLFDNDLTRQNATPSSIPEFTSSTFRTGLETTPEASQFFYDEAMSVPIYWVAQIYPSAVYYNGRTYFTWQGEDLDPFIIYYNHTTDTWSDAVEVGDNPLDPGSSDYHGAPALLIDANGFLHVFYGAHGFDGDLKHSKSDSAEDISSWTVQSNPTTSDVTYPQLVKSADDHIFLAYRIDISSITHRGLAFKESADNASTWGSENTIVDFGDGYQVYPFNWELEGTDQLHFAWRVFQGALSRSPRSYHAIFNTSDDRVYSVSGTDLGVSVNRTEADNDLLIMDTNNIAVGTLHLDTFGTPYLIQSQQDVVSEGWNQTFIRWNGTGWENETITPDSPASASIAGQADFIVLSSSNIEAYLVTETASTEGGDIERWSWNGATWSQQQVLLTEAVSGVPLASPTVPIDNDSELTVFFAQVNRADFTNNDLKVYAHDGTDFVFGNISFGGQWANASHSETLDMENTNVSLIWWGQVRDTRFQYITGKGCSSSIGFVYGLMLDTQNQIMAQVSSSEPCVSDFISSNLPVNGLSQSQTYGIGVVFEDNSWGADVHFWLDGQWIYNETSTERIGDTGSNFYVGRSENAYVPTFCNCTHDEVLVFKERLSNETMKLLTTPEHDIVIRSGPRTTTQGFEGLFFALPWLIVFGLLGWLFYIIAMAWREPFTRD